jgi:hypothetical protein
MVAYRRAEESGKLRRIGRPARRRRIDMSNLTAIENSHRMAIQFAVWHLADRAAAAGQVVDVGHAARDLAERYSKSGLSIEEIRGLVEQAAIEKRVVIVSDHRSVEAA